MKDDYGKQALRLLRGVIERESGKALSADGLRELAKIIASLPVQHRLPSGDVKLMEVTVLFADLRGFTALSATFPQKLVIEVLNRYLSMMAEIIEVYQGTIDKFMGDALMVLFGAPVPRNDDVERAVACAVDMQVAMAKLNVELVREGFPELYVGIGINTGPAMAGRFGGEAYSEYTVIGEEVNLASRIEAFSLRGQVLISEKTFARVEGRVETGEPMQITFKGKSLPISVRELLGIPGMELYAPRQDPRRSRRVATRVGASIRQLQNKVVMPAVNDGTIIDIGYHGVRLQCETPLPLHADVKLDFSLELVEYRSRDVYAKVVSARNERDFHIHGLEFTSLNPTAAEKIRLFVQMQIGSD
jgi:adenylate cyclase